MVIKTNYTGITMSQRATRRLGVRGRGLEVRGWGEGKVRGEFEAPVTAKSAGSLAKGWG